MRIPAAIRSHTFLHLSGRIPRVSQMGGFTRSFRPELQELEDRTLLASGFVLALFQNALGRAASSSDIDYWSSAASAAGNAAVASAIDQSHEARTRLVQGWYAQDLGRPAQNGEEQWWVNNLGNASEEIMRGGILASDEFFSHVQEAFAESSPEASFVAALYNQILNRSPSVGEIAGWAGSVASAGHFSIAEAFLTSDEYRASIVGSFYADLLQRAKAPSPGEIGSWVHSGLDLGTIRRQFEGSPEFAHLNALSVTLLDGRIQEGTSFTVTVAATSGAGTVTGDLLYDGNAVLHLPDQTLSSNGAGTFSYDIPDAFLPDNIPEDSYVLRLQAGATQASEPIVVTAAPELGVSLSDARIQEGSSFEVGIVAPFGNTEVDADLYHNGQLIPDSFAGFKQVGEDGTATISYNMPKHLLQGGAGEDGFDITFSCAGLTKMIRVTVTAAAALLVDLSGTRIQEGSTFKASLAEGFLDPPIGNTDIVNELWHDGVLEHTFGVRQMGADGTATVSQTMPKGFLGKADEDAFDLVFKAAGLENSIHIVITKASNSSGDPLPPAKTAKPPAHVPASPDPVNLAAKSNSEIQVTWAKAANADNYNVYRSTGKQWTKLATVPADTTTYTATGLNPAQTYWFKVEATNTGGTVHSSSTQQTTTGKPSLSPAPPQTFVFLFPGWHQPGTKYTSGLDTVYSDIKSKPAAYGSLVQIIPPLSFNLDPVPSLDGDRDLQDAFTYVLAVLSAHHRAATDKVILVGHSYGGNLAYLLASDLNSNGIHVTGLITLDPIDWNNLPPVDQSNETRPLPGGLSQGDVRDYVERNSVLLSPDGGLKGYSIGSSLRDIDMSYLGVTHTTIDTNATVLWHVDAFIALLGKS